MITRRQVLNFRARTQQLDRDTGTLADTCVLDLGVQDTGPDGAKWALALRGVDPAALSGDDVVLLWTVRGAPHLYRRSDVAEVAAAVEPYSEADAGNRIVTAAQPLEAAGIGNFAALDEVAARMRDIVTEPTVKGDVSGRLAELLPRPYSRHCQRCDAVHVYEMPFRLAAVRAGLELRPGTSPPVLQRIPAFRKAAVASRRFGLVRCYLRLLGPATPKQVAEYLEAPIVDVKAHWPDDTIPVTVDGEQRWLLTGDEDALRSAEPVGVRLLGPYDPYLQARDRQTLVPDRDRAKQLWRSLGRPGAVLADGELVGSWRVRRTGKRLAVTVNPWHELSAATVNDVTEQAERLAAYRDTPLKSVEFDAT